MQEERSSHAAHTVLVVEDEPAVRRMVQRILEDAGFGVLVAENGAQALELLETAPHAVDLVFADVRMPHVSGATLGRVLAQSRPDLPVLYTSGWPEEQHPDTSQLAPGATVVPKPLRPEQLVEQVRLALTRARA